MTTDRLHLRPKHRRILEELLQKHLPEVEVWAYGSRITGRSHDGSDLDLVLRGPELRKIPIENLTEFEEALRESPIPFLVEARDWARLPERFHREIERDYVMLCEKTLNVFSRSAWATATIDDISEKVAMGPFGSSIKVSTFVPEGIPIISGQHLHGIRVDDSPGFNFISHEHAQRLSNANVQPGDVIFTHAGNIGQVAYIPAQSKFDRYIISQRQFYMRCNRSKVIPEFVALYFKSPEGQHQLLANTAQVGVPSIAQPVTYLRTIEIPLPPLPEQRAIAHILGTLDDKIELNRRMNETLEEMARALFKSWFIDFDPVRAKMTLKCHRTNNSPLEGERARSARGGSGTTTKPPTPWHNIQRAYSPKTLQRAKNLRQNQTDAEGLLWHYLRGKQLGGHKFRRQQPIGPYIADFACMPSKLLIELDGGGHAEQQSYDERRDAYLRERGYRVLRVWNNDVFENCTGVLERIYLELVGLEDAGFSEGGTASAQQPAAAASPHGRYAPTPPQGGSNWSVERARAYLEHLGDDIADLFPNRMVDSELGEIPEGWAARKLSETIDLNPKRPLQNAKLAPYLDMANMPANGHVPDVVRERPYGSGMRFTNGDTLMARITPCLENGKTAYVDFLKDGETGWGSTEYIVLKPIPPLPDEFAYYLARSAGFREFAIQNMTGTSGRQRVPAKALSEFLLPLPSNSIVVEFGRIVRSILSRVSEATQESSTLAALRDALLVKLISGEFHAYESGTQTNLSDDKLQTLVTTEYFSVVQIE